MNKIVDYMAAGLPTIIGVAAANDPIREAGAGLSVAPENPAALAGAIIELSGLGRERLLEMSLAGRRYVAANHDMDGLARRLAETLNSCIGTS